MVLVCGNPLEVVGWDFSKFLWFDVGNDTRIKLCEDV